LELHLINYSVQVILSILCIAMIILFYVRKRMVGVIIGKASSLRIRFFFLVMGLFMLVTAFTGLYHDVLVKGKISDMGLYGFITGLTMAASFMTNFLTSKIHIGLKGVSVPVIPFFISRNQIIGYEIVSNTLVLRRKGENIFKIPFEINDVKNVESAIILLQNDND